MKWRVKVGDMYFVRFDDMMVVMVVDDSPGSIDQAETFDTFGEACNVAFTIGARPEFYDGGVE